MHRIFTYLNQMHSSIKSIKYFNFVGQHASRPGCQLEFKNLNLIIFWSKCVLCLPLEYFEQFDCTACSKHAQLHDLNFGLKIVSLNQKIKTNLKFSLVNIFQQIWHHLFIMPNTAKLLLYKWVSWWQKGISWWQNKRLPYIYFNSYHKDASSMRCIPQLHTEWTYCMLD